jgi:hypothetical protein
MLTYQEDGDAGGSKHNSHIPPRQSGNRHAPGAHEALFGSHGRLHLLSGRVAEVAQQGRNSVYIWQRKLDGMRQ